MRDRTPTAHRIGMRLPTPRRLAPATLALLALVSACNRSKPTPPPPATAVAAPPPATVPEWSFYELGSLVVIEGEVTQPTRLTLEGATLKEEREAEVGPVRWELYKPGVTQEVELKDHQGRRLGAWTFRGLRAKTQDLPPPLELPSNGGPSETEVAALAAKITWSTTGSEGSRADARPIPPSYQPGPAGRLPQVPASRASVSGEGGASAQDLRSVPAPPRTGSAPPEPAPQVGRIPTSRMPLPSSRAGLVLPGDPRSPQALPEAIPQVHPVVPPRVAATRPQTPPSWADPRRPGILPEATPRVSPVVPPRVGTSRSQAFATPADPRRPGVLPDPTPKVTPVVPPRVAPSRSQAFATPSDPRLPGVLPEATPRVTPVVPPRVGTSRSQVFAPPTDPRLPGVLPEATPRVSPVVPPRVGTARSLAFATPTSPRLPGVLPEATPSVRPVVPPRTTLPPGRAGLIARLDPAVPAPLPEATRPEPPLKPGTWPGGGEALNLIRGPRSGKRLVLTFDGGSNAEAAHEILDTLRAKGVRTTFFLTGVFIQSFPDITRRIAQEGHEIGNHTQNHPHLAPNMRRDPLWTREAFRDELLAADNALYHLLGRPMDPIWRAPYGEHTAEIRKWAEELGYRHIGWSEGADTLDWATPKERKLYRTGDAILERLHSRLQRDGDGLIALMHLGSERDEQDRPSRNLSRFVDRALREGWRFVTVGDYLHTMGKPAWDPARRMAWLNNHRVSGTN